MTNLELIQQLYGALLGGDPAQVASFLDESFVARSPASLPYGGEARGADGLFAMLGGFMAHWEEPQFDLKGFTTNDDLVVAHIALKAKSRRTGRSLDTQVVESWRLSNGKVTEMQAFYADAGQAAHILTDEVAQ